MHIVYFYINYSDTNNILKRFNYNIQDLKNIDFDLLKNKILFNKIELERLKISNMEASIKNNDSNYRKTNFMSTPTGENTIINKNKENIKNKVKKRIINDY